jgi:hypothetical protein
LRVPHRARQPRRVGVRVAVDPDEEAVELHDTFLQVKLWRCERGGVPAYL